MTTHSGISSSGDDLEQEVAPLPSPSRNVASSLLRIHNTILENLEGCYKLENVTNLVHELMDIATETNRNVNLLTKESSDFEDRIAVSEHMRQEALRRVTEVEGRLSQLEDTWKAKYQKVCDELDNIENNALANNAIDVNPIRKQRSNTSFDDYEEPSMRDIIEERDRLKDALYDLNVSAKRIGNAHDEEVAEFQAELRETETRWGRLLAERDSECLTLQKRNNDVIAQMKSLNEEHRLRECEFKEKEQERQGAMDKLLELSHKKSVAPEMDMLKLATTAAIEDSTSGVIHLHVHQHTHRHHHDHVHNHQHAYYGANTTPPVSAKSITDSTSIVTSATLATGQRKVKVSSSGPAVPVVVVTN